MSIPVELAALADVLGRYSFAYLLTASEGGAPHAVAVDAVFSDGRFRIDGAGRRTRANATARSAVALLWPPTEPGGYSLIVDGDARVDGDRLEVSPTRAVQHRPAPAATAPVEGCGADCIELELPAPGRPR